MLRPLIALTLLLAGCPTEELPVVEDPTPAPPAITVALEDAPEVDAAVQEIVDADELTGVTVGIARGQTIVYLQGFGYADVEAEIPVDPSVTRFRWASVAKSLAGVVAVQGIADGITALDTDVEATVPDYVVPDRYLPGDCQASACVESLPEEERAITLQQLLNHTAGIQHYGNGLVYPVPPPSATDDPFVNTGIAWAIDYFANAPLVSRPGVAYDYSTFGYNLAGVVLEELHDGTPFGELVDAGIAQPLGMTTMSPDFQWEEIPNRAIGYVNDNGTIGRDGDNDVSWKLPGGGFLSSGEDLTRYCAGLLGDPIVTDEERELLWTTGEPNDDYGLGFGVGTWDGEAYISHTGAQQKTRTALILLPESDLCFTVMTNATWANPGALGRAVRDAWLSGPS